MNLKINLKKLNYCQCIKYITIFYVKLAVRKTIIKAFDFCLSLLPGIFCMKMGVALLNSIETEKKLHFRKNFCIYVIYL